MKLIYSLALIAISFIVLAVYSGREETFSKYVESREMIALRRVMHELLLSSGDSTSRVLPVKKISENEFHVYPENNLSIQPESLVNIVNKIVNRKELSANFTASIIKSSSKETVYGFVPSLNTKDNTAPCLGRALPNDAYYLSFMFSPKQEPLLSNKWFLAGAAVAILSFLFFFFYKKNKAKAVNTLEDTDTVDDEIEDKSLIQIGRYIFNAGQQYLELDGNKTALTVKESKLLSILADKPDRIIERDTLQKEVWENEGVIVTRSLDMFMSKLRKKLSGDPVVKIVNIHGKGYKLETGTMV